MKRSKSVDLNLIRPKSFKKDQSINVGSSVEQELAFFSPSSVFITSSTITKAEDKDFSFEKDRVVTIPRQNCKPILYDSINTAAFDHILLSILNRFPSQNRSKKRLKAIINEKFTPKNIKKQLCIKYLNTGCRKYSYIGILCGLSRQEVRSLAIKSLKENTNIIKKRGPCPKITPEIREHIQKRVLNNKDKPITVTLLRRELLEEFPVLNGKLSLSLVVRTLHKLNIFKKKIIYYIERKNHPDVKKQRKDCVIKLMKLIADGRHIIYIDETSVNLQIRQLTSYVKRGTRFCLKLAPKSKNYTLISAIDQYGHLGSVLLKGGMKSRDFAGFLCLLKNNCEPDIFDNHIVFLDNASAHKSKFIQDTVGSKFNLFYNAPYTPQLNAIEEFFSLFKSKLRKMEFKTEKELVISVMKVLNDIFFFVCERYVMHTISFFRTMYNLEDII